MKKINTYRLRTLLLISALTAIHLSLFGQKTISGVVTDTEGVTLIGANILVKNTTIGTVTDIDGSYSLQVPDDASVLVASYTGYNTVEIPIEGTTINIVLPEGELLDEIVVIGYGEIKREDATGSIQTVTSKSFNQGVIAGPQQLLAGKVAGVSITTGGDPGGGSAIRIRGESSLGASNDPLIVIDGVPLDNSDTAGSRNNLNLINPADIESMTVLKDASATAIYGNRASAGVILITTKKGKLGKLKVGYNANVSIGNVTKTVDVLSADEFRDAVNTYVDSTNSARTLLTDGQGTNWQDQIYQQAFGTDHNLNLSGGVGQIPFRASLGYTDFNGLLKTDNFSRLSGNINLTPGFFDNTLQLNIGLKASQINNKFADRGAIGSALSFDPTKPVMVEDTTYGGFFAWTNPDSTVVGLSTSNPVALLQQQENISDVNRYIATVSADYRMPFLPSLRANVNLSYDRTTTEGTRMAPQNAAWAFNPMTGGGINNFYQQEKSSKLFEGFLNYKEEVLGNTLEVMVGHSYQDFDVSLDTFNNQAVNPGPDTLNRDDNPRELVMLSNFGRINYNIKDRLILTGTIRQDFTSRFGPDNRMGLFPSAAAALKLINNDRLLFNNLKVRLGWGRTGQQEIGGYYLYQGLYELSQPTAAYQIGNQFLATARPNGFDSGIQWETTTTYNAGVDVSVINNRLSATIDVYRRNTEDLLTDNVQTVVGSNLTNIVVTNFGSMISEGVEIGLNLTPILTEKSSWDLNINAAYNRNEITKLNNDATSIGVAVGGISGGVGNNVQVHTVGFEPYSFFVFRQAYDSETGNILAGVFINNEGELTENPTDEDKYRIEAARPDVVLGLTSNYRYQNFDFSFAARANIGNKVYNNVQTDLGNLARLPNLGILNNIHPVAIEQNIQLQEQVIFSDHFVEDASFLRFDHITLGYTFPNLLGDYLRVYSTVQNPFIVTSYSGIDPEIFGGIDNTTYPRNRTFVFGLSVQF